jgi:predicted SAM-dependent methyltransferase
LDFGDNHVTLYDISSNKVDNLSPSIKHATKLNDLASNSQDHIVAFHVMEHLENPFSALLEMKLKLKTDGRIWISVPDKENSFFEFSHLDWPPHHVSRFSRESLQILGERAGFTLIEYIPGVSNSHGIFDFMMVFKKQNY